MKDVAREAGVALGTVSKVVNGIPVGKSYQRAVEEANDRLGYYVNRQARALRSMESSFELEQSYRKSRGRFSVSVLSVHAMSRAFLVVATGLEPVTPLM